MRILVACERSGLVRDAFAAYGHDAWSCDIVPSTRPGNHYCGDIRNIILEPWDLMIAHPPCTHLAVSGARWFKEKEQEQREALWFVGIFMTSSIPHIAIENPVSVISSKFRPADQVIHPWQFGHPEQKATCLWLKNLPPLTPTNNVRKKMMQLERKDRERIHFLPKTEDRAILRSETYQGIADAMASQWTSYLVTL